MPEYCALLPYMARRIFFSQRIFMGRSLMGFVIVLSSDFFFKMKLNIFLDTLILTIFL